MKKIKKYLVFILKYTIKKREPNIKVIDLVNTEEEALKLCKKQFTDYMEVWAKHWPQDPYDFSKRNKLIYPDFIKETAKWVK